MALDTNVTSQLMNHLLESDVAVQGLRSFGGVETKLRWGEVIPFWFLQKYLVNGIYIKVIYINFIYINLLAAYSAQWYMSREHDQQD